MTTAELGTVCMSAPMPSSFHPARMSSQSFHIHVVFGAHQASGPMPVGMRRRLGSVLNPDICVMMFFEKMVAAHETCGNEVMAYTGAALVVSKDLDNFLA